MAAAAVIGSLNMPSHLENGRLLVSSTLPRSYRSAIGESLNQLLGGPLRCWVLGNVEVQTFPPTMSENNEDEQHLEAKRQRGTEVDKDDLHSVILQSRLTVLGWRAQ